MPELLRHSSEPGCEQITGLLRSQVRGASVVCLSRQAFYFLLDPVVAALLRRTRMKQRTEYRYWVEGNY